LIECDTFHQRDVSNRSYLLKVKALEFIEREIRNYPYVEANAGLSLTRRRNDRIQDKWKEIKKLVDRI